MFILLWCGPLRILCTFASSWITPKSVLPLRQMRILFGGTQSSQLNCRNVHCVRGWLGAYKSLKHSICICSVSCIGVWTASQCFLHLRLVVGEQSIWGLNVSLLLVDLTANRSSASLFSQCVFAHLCVHRPQTARPKWTVPLERTFVIEICTASGVLWCLFFCVCVLLTRNIPQLLLRFLMTSFRLLPPLLPRCPFNAHFEPRPSISRSDNYTHANVCRGNV